MSLASGTGASNGKKKIEDEYVVGALACDSKIDGGGYGGGVPMIGEEEGPLINEGHICL